MEQEAQMEHNCRFCKRKYKREAKFIKHMESAHPFASFHSNTRLLNNTQRHYLISQLQIYSQLIPVAANFENDHIDNAITQYLQWNGEAPTNKWVIFVWASHMLLTQNYHAFVSKSQDGGPLRNRPDELASHFHNSIDAVDADNAVDAVDAPTSDIEISECERDKDLKIELKRIVHNHLTFCRRAVESEMLQKAISSISQIELLLDEFNRFLNLGFTWRKDNFCPSMPIDLVWHASMMNPIKYQELCKIFLGKLLPHCLIENEDQHEVRFQEFVKQFKHHHNRDIIELQK